MATPYTDLAQDIQAVIDKHSKVIPEINSPVRQYGIESIIKQLVTAVWYATENAKNNEGMK